MHHALDLSGFGVRDRSKARPLLSRLMFLFALMTSLRVVACSQAKAISVPACSNVPETVKLVTGEEENVVQNSVNKEAVTNETSSPRQRIRSRRGRGRVFPNPRQRYRGVLRQKLPNRSHPWLRFKGFGTPLELVSSTGPLGEEGRLLVLRKRLKDSSTSAQVVVERGSGATTFGVRQKLSEKSWVIPSLCLRTGALSYWFSRSLDWGEVEAKVEPGREVAVRWEGDVGGVWRVETFVHMADMPSSRISFRRAWNMYGD
ncbi:unnamed protein product [Discosporangium mesarthrocarpum]